MEGNSDLKSQPSRSFRWNWIGLATVAIMAAALIYQISQTRILEEQLERQFAEPILRAEAFRHSTERVGLAGAKDSITEELFQRVEELKRQDPQLSYIEILSMVLPISRELSPAPILINISIENVGSVAAEDVTTSISWQGEIIRVDVDSLSDWTISKGGDGEAEATIQLERIAEGETIKIGVEFAAYSDAKDTLVLNMDEPSAAAVISAWPDSSSEDLSFPALRVEEDEAVIGYDAIDVRIVSDRTSVQVVEVEPLFSGFFAAYQDAIASFPTPSE